VIVSLLPPDPEKAGQFWINRPSDLPPDIWEWLPTKREWWRRTGDKQQCSPEWAAIHGYTLAVPFRILSPEEIAAVHAVAGRLHSEKEAASRRCGRYVVGTADWAKESASVAAYADAAELLRRALP